MKSKYVKPSIVNESGNENAIPAALAGVMAAVAAGVQVGAAARKAMGRIDCDYHSRQNLSE